MLHFPLTAEDLLIHSEQTKAQKEFAAVLANYLNACYTAASRGELLEEEIAALHDQAGKCSGARRILLSDVLDLVEWAAMQGYKDFLRRTIPLLPEEEQEEILRPYREKYELVKDGIKC